MKFQNSIDIRFIRISFRNPLLYLLLSIKIITVLGLNFINDKNFPKNGNTNTILANYGGDSHAYIKPIDNFIEEGEYYYQEHHEKVYAGRAPYYGSFYFVIRQFFDRNTALDILALIQIITDCFAGLVMAVLMLRITQTPWTFWATLLLYNLSFYQTDYSGRILTESLSNSALVFFAYFMYLLYNDKKTANYLQAGIWLSIAVVLKPYFAPLFLLILLQYDKSKSPVKNLLSAMVFSSSLLVITIPFTVRNYVRFNTIQPFSSFDGGSGITQGEFAFRKYLQSLGESIIFWDPDCAGCLFTNMDVPCNYNIPARIYTEKTDSVEFNKARELYINYLNNKTTENEKYVIQRFDSLRVDYRESRPFMYYAGSRILLTSRFIFQKASYYIPNPFTGSLYYLVGAIKAFQYLIYYFIMIAGIPVLLFFAFKNFRIWIILGTVPIYLIMLFPIILGGIEWRFWTNSHYFLIMCAIYFLYHLKNTYFSNHTRL